MVLTLVKEPGDLTVTAKQGEAGSMSWSGEVTVARDRVGTVDMEESRQIAGVFTGREPAQMGQIKIYVTPKF